MDDLDRAYFGTDEEQQDQIGFLDAKTRAVFERGYGAEPDGLVEQLRKDAASRKLISWAVTCLALR